MSLLSQRLPTPPAPRPRRRDSRPHSRPGLRQHRGTVNRIKRIKADQAAALRPSLIGRHVSCRSPVVRTRAPSGTFLNGMPGFRVIRLIGRGGGAQRRFDLAVEAFAPSREPSCAQEPLAAVSRTRASCASAQCPASSKPPRRGGQQAKLLVEVERDTGAGRAGDLVRLRLLGGHGLPATVAHHRQVLRRWQEQAQVRRSARASPTRMSAGPGQRRCPSAHEPAVPALHSGEM